MNDKKKSNIDVVISNCNNIIFNIQHKMFECCKNDHQKIIFVYGMDILATFVFLRLILVQVTKHVRSVHVEITVGGCKIQQCLTFLKKFNILTCNCPPPQNPIFYVFWDNFSQGGKKVFGIILNRKSDNITVVIAKMSQNQKSVNRGSSLYNGFAPCCNCFLIQQFQLIDVPRFLGWVLA
eukprot:TRINITY_DN3014_c0_g1_i4.p2 TRINITY_DN3014_c0_g1~~TRINITY_DN3014_c0_g1_i4.p2  ORF type:complete len:180 (-),score=4.60 TRINITY_DN3014_c0_g1_i4:5-544(-)